MSLCVYYLWFMCGEVHFTLHMLRETHILLLSNIIWYVYSFNSDVETIFHIVGIL